MTKYIVGRPLKVGEDQLDVGDTLTKKQLDMIPRLESWISMRHIYVVATQRDLDKLPRFLVHRISLAKKAVDRNEATNFGDTERAIKGREDNRNDRATHIAKRDAKEQEVIYGLRRSKSLAAEEAEVDAQIEEIVAPAAVPEPEEATPEEIVERPESSGDFNPTEHTVAEVKDYIETNPDEKDAVLAAEAAGKARASLLE